MKRIIEKYQQLDVVAKASIIYVLVGFFQKGISLVSGPIFTRILSQSDYGVFSAFNSWYELIGVIAMLSLSAGVYNNGLMEFENDRDCFSFSMLILSNLATLLVYAFIRGGKRHIITLIGLPKELILIMIICYFFSPALIFWTTRQRYEFKYIKSCAVTLISTILAVGCSIIITWNSGNDFKLINKIYSEKSILLIFWIVIYIYIAYKAKFKIKVQYWKYALKFNLPLIPHYLSNYILNSIDRLMIMNLVSSNAAAIYSVAYSAAFLIQIFWQSINGAILPMTYENIKNGKEKEIQGKALPFLVIYGGLCIGVSCVAPELMTILSPKSYQEGMYLIPILTIGAYINGLYCLFANVEFFYKSTKVIAINSIVSAMLNIGLNYIFINKYGYVAAAYTTVASYLVQTFLHYINYKRLSKRIYEEKKLILISMGVFGGCMVCIPLYSKIVIRYICLALSLMMIVYKRKTIISFYRKLKN